MPLFRAVESDDVAARDAGASGVRRGPAAVLEFEQVYRDHLLTVRRWVRALGGPAQYNEDIVQEVFVVVYRRLPSFDGKNLVGWLYQITRRRVRDFRRLLWFRSFFASGDIGETLVSPDESPEAALSDHQEARDKTALLNRLLDRLPEAQRAAFVLFEIEGYSGEQIAEFQDAPLNTVWARIRKARLALLKHGQRVLRAEGRV